MDGGGFVANNEFDADTKIPSYLRDVVDSNIEQIVQKNSIFNIYLTIVEIFYFCIIAQEDILNGLTELLLFLCRIMGFEMSKMVSELDKYLINNLSHKLESSGWVVYFETVAEILAEILLMFSTVVQTIGIYNTRICIH